MCTFLSIPIHLRQYKKKKSREIDALMKRRLSVLVGRMVKVHYQDNFRKGGFLNGGLQKWPITSRQALGKGAQQGPLLSRRNHLFSSSTCPLIIVSQSLTIALCTHP